MIHGQYHYFPAASVDPATLSLGADGGLYLPTNLSFMRSDQFGTAASVGSAVSLILDQWVSNTPGSNLVTNGTFTSSATGWTGSGATVASIATHGVVTNTGAAVGRAFQSITTVVGATYKCTFDLLANADGAAFCVGTTNSGTTLANRTFAAGTTGTTLEVWFIATTTSSFIQLRTNVATSGKLTTWDNVTCANIPGRHLLQQTSASAPILRTDANGNNYLEFSSTQFIAGGFSYTLQPSTYVAACARRNDGGNTTSTLVGLAKNSTNGFRLAYGGTRRAQSILVDATLGTTTAVTPNNVWGDQNLAVVDSLIAAGSNDICHNRLSPASITNTWTGGSSQTLCAPGLCISGTGASATGQPANIYGACFMSQDPGANRPGIRTYLASLAGAD